MADKLRRVEKQAGLALREESFLAGSEQLRVTPE
jgi:hypothetical protein